jgi:PadR family transcriptional regulator PadR
MARRPNSSAQAALLFESLLGGDGEWRYGYDLSRETGLKSGTLYPLLMRLENQGLLETKWTDSGQRGRPPRHLYRLNSRGIAAAQGALQGSHGRETPRLSLTREARP